MMIDLRNFPDDPVKELDGLVDNLQKFVRKYLAYKTLMEPKVIDLRLNATDLSLLLLALNRYENKRKKDKVSAMQEEYGSCSVYFIDSEESLEEMIKNVKVKIEENKNV